MAAKKMNEIEKVIKSLFGSPCPRWVQLDSDKSSELLRRKLRALVRKAHILGGNRATVTNQYGGDQLRQYEAEYDQEFKEQFGFKP